MKRHLLFLLVFLCARAHAQLPAFPGAEGFGSIASGGRGGDVYYVTNLNASGAGSFAYGVQNAPAAGRTIIFAVSGHIRLPSGSGGGLTIDKDKITVAGQTAPGDGICFWNNTMNITGDDLVFRDVRWRYGYSAAGGDSVDISGSQRIIFDHCDLMFGTDENMSSFGTAPEHLTFQWSTNAWGLYGHSCGGLWKTRHATVHHTLWANNHTRNPKLIGCDVFDWVNNLTFGWDYGFNMAQEFTGGTGTTYRVNIRNSSFVHGGSTSSAIYGGGTNDDGSTKFKLHMSDAALDGNNNGILDVSRTNYQLVSSGTTYGQTTTAWPQTTDGNSANPVIGVQINAVPRLTAYKKILSQVGATRMEIGSRPLRDEITRLLADKTATLQRTPISNPLELGLTTDTAFADLQSASAPTDTDLDGMPDDWEDAVGYDKAVAENNIVLTAPETATSFFPTGSPAGYTRLEEYLHYKAVPHGTVAKNTAVSPTFIDIDLRKFTSGFTASPVFTISNIINGAITQSGNGNSIVRFTPTQDHSGRAGFHFAVTDSAGATWTQQCCLLVSTKTQARPVTWVGDGTTNNWDTATANFTSLLGPTAFTNGDAVTIDDTGSNSPTLKIIGPLTPASLSVSNSTKNFTLEGGGNLSGTGGLTKSGSGTLTLKVNHTGTGASQIDGGSVILGGSANTGSLPSGKLTLQNGVIITNAWPNSASTQNITAPLFIPEGQSATLQSGRRIQLSGSLTGGGNLNIVNQGSDGVMEFRGAMNTFAGNLNISFTGTNGASKAIFNGASFNGWAAANVTFPAGMNLTCTTNSTGNTFGIGALSGGGSIGTGSSGAPNITIGALNLDTTFAGGFTGNAKLTKTGTGRLILTGTSSHTGTTTISNGELAMNGIFGNSAVTVASGGTLTGTGTFAGTLATTAGGIISPGSGGGLDSGTLTAASLALTSPTLRFDLSNNPAGANDRIIISTGGAIALTDAQNIVFNLTNGTLGAGTYDLITSSGILTTTNVTLSSNLPIGSRQTLTLEHSPTGTAPGYVRLVVSGTNADLIWTGANGGLWDQQTTNAWTGASPGTFFNFDGVTFSDSASNSNITITQPVAPRNLTINNTTARPYTFTGAPITGTTSLVKSGTGSLTLNVPQYALTNCTTTSGSPTVTVSSTTGLVPGMTVIGTGIPADTTVVSIASATAVTLSQNSTATSTTASLTFETRNTFSGGTILNAGTLVLACNNWQYYSSTTPPPSNTFGLGPGPITLNGGTLTLLGHTGNAQHLYGALPNNLIVPAGKTATLQTTLRGTSFNDFAGLRGSLTGSGTLNLAVNFKYGVITGDWSAFSGTLNVTPPSSGINDPRFQLGNELGLPLATISLNQVQLEYTATPPVEGITIPLGSLSGTSNSVISGGQYGFGPVTWRVGSLNTSTTFAGSFTPFESRPIGIAKTGTGIWTLTGGGTVSAGITVEQGTLSYGDSSTDAITGTSAINVQTGATLQLNFGATLTGTSLEISSGATLRGRGTINAESSCGGTLDIIGGSLDLTGDTFLGGSTVRFNSFTDRLNVAGSLSLDGQLELPTAGLSFGRKPLITYTGLLDLGNVTFAALPASYLPILDTGTAGEIAVLLIDQTAYQSWQTIHFGNTTTPDGAPLADPDNDGMTNLEEYEAGTDPKLGTSFIPLVWQGGGANPWDNAITATWLENTTPRVFRDKRHLTINDNGSNSPAIDLRDTVLPGSLTVSNTTKAFTISGDGSISGSSGLAKSGTNTLTLAVSNDFTGATSISAGVVNIQTDTALGTAALGTTIANNARLELQNNITVTGESLDLTGQGGSTFYNGALNSKSGSNTWTGPVTLVTTGTRIGAQAGSTLIISGPIASGSGSTGLIVRPADMTATVILSGSNTYTGDTSIVGGVLKLGASNTLPVGTSLKFGLSAISGKLDLNGFNQEITSLAVISGTTNEITSSNPATLTVNSASDSTFSAPITGRVSLAKSGPATLALTSASTYTGTTTVNAGKLLLDLSALAIPTDLLNPVSSLTLGGTLELKGKPATSSTQTLGNLTIPAAASATIIVTSNTSSSTNLTLGNTWTLGENATLLIDLSAGNTTLTSSPALTNGFLPGVSVKDAIATGPATVVAGKIVRYIPPTLTVSSNDANVEFSSLSSAYPAGTLNWTDGGTLTARAVHRLILDTTTIGGTIDLGAPANILTLSSGEIQFFGTNNLTVTGGQIGATGSAVSLSTAGNAALTFGSPISGGTGSLAISGTANVVLNSPSTFTGGLTLNGGTLKQGIAGALGSANGALAINSGMLDLNGLNTGLGILTGTGGSITSTTAATLTLGNNNATGGNFAGSISGSISLTKTGTGIQTLSGNNPYTGLTTVGAGTLRSAADNAIGNGDISLNGGTLDLQTFSDSVAALTLTSGTINGTNGFLTACSYTLTSGMISARIGGASATLTKYAGTYASSVTLSGANTYGGATTLGTNSGSLAIAHNDALGNTSAVDVLGTGTALVLANGISITGKPITIRGTGANNNTIGSFGGSLTTSASATATWTGSITLGDGNGRLGAGNSGTLNLTGPILGSGANQSISLSSGSGTSIGTVVLSGTNNFTANISLVRGNLKLGAANTLPATAIIDVGSANVPENTTFDLNGFPQTLAGLKRTGTNPTQVSTVTNSSSATSATLTLNQSTSLAYSGIITGNLTLAKSGAGTLTLSNSNALSNTVSMMLDGGALSLASSHTITALRINGVWQAPGTYTSANSSGRISGAGSLTVTTSGPIGFATWIDGFTTLVSEQKLPTADPDQDSVNNLLEYVLNGIPNIANPGILPIPSLTPTHFVFTFSRREESANTTTQIFEYGPTPGNWTPVNITAPTAAEVSLGTVSNGLRTVIVNIPRATAPDGKLFGRLKVSQP